MNDFLISLNRFSPKVSNNPTENFITASLAWILQSDPEFGRFFLRNLRLPELTTLTASDNLSWSIQENWNGVFPDMVCRIEGWPGIIIFEHKTWTHLGQGQLRSYFDAAQNKYPEYAKDNIKVVVITAASHQWPLESDLCHCKLCWQNVSIFIDRFLEGRASAQSEHSSNSSTAAVCGFLLEQFNALLDNHGLGQIAGFKAEEIVGYRSDFVQRVDTLWRVISEHLDRWILETLPKVSGQIDYSVSPTGYQWGRTGIELFSEWRPSIFIGSLLSPDDHHVQFSDSNLGPDVVVILSFQEHNQQSYQSASYRIFREEFNALESLPTGWMVYDHHCETPPGKENRFHPLYIRRSMVSALSGSKGNSIQNQAEYLFEQIKGVLTPLFERTSLLPFRESFEATEATLLNPFLNTVRFVNYLKQKHHSDLSLVRRNSYYKDSFVESHLVSASQFSRFDLWPQNDGLFIRFHHQGNTHKSVSEFGLEENCHFAVQPMLNFWPILQL